MMTLYITGSNGYIGSVLYEYFRRQTSLNVVGIEYGKCFYSDNVIVSDFKDVEFLKSKIRANAFVIHTAAFVPKVFDIFDASVENVNLDITSFIISVFSTKNVVKFINFSSISVYGYGQVELSNCTENSPIFLGTSYARAKYNAEIILSSYFPCVYNLRISSPVHYLQKSGLFHFLFMSVFKDKLVQLYSGGNRRQDYIAVKDIARVIELVLFKETEAGVYNVARGHSYSVKEVVDGILRFSKDNVNVVSENIKEDYSVSISNEKLLNNLSIATDFFTPLHEILEEFVKMRENDF